MYQKRVSTTSAHLVLRNTHTRRIETRGSGRKWKIVRGMILIANSVTVHCIVDKIGGDPNCGLFAIFDGHGGKQVSEYCAERFPIEIRKELQKSPADLCKPLTEVFAKVRLKVMTYD